MSGGKYGVVVMLCVLQGVAGRCCVARLLTDFCQGARGHVQPALDFSLLVGADIAVGIAYRIIQIDITWTCIRAIIPIPAD